MSLESFHEREKKRKESSPDFPAVTIGTDQTTCSLLLELRESLGHPEHIKFFFNDPKLAITPSDEEDPNSYVVNNGSVAIGWLGTEWGWIPDPGRYRAKVEDGYAVVDFEEDSVGGEST